MTKLQGVLGELQNFLITLVGTILMGKGLNRQDAENAKKEEKLRELIICQSLLGRLLDTLM
jgi:hypothetical protein